MEYFTVEYDGYTYKKEETENKKTIGADYLTTLLNPNKSELKELERIIHRMHTKSKWKDLSDKQERMYSKMEKVLSKLKAYSPFSMPFLNKVSKREAPEYYNMIKKPMDLGKIGKKLFLQEYVDINGFTADLELIWENCFKFNNSHGNAYAMYAQKMKERSVVLLQDLFSEREVEIEEVLDIPHFMASEVIRKEMVGMRAAILQNPGEFTQKRNEKGMCEYWRMEVGAIKALQLYKDPENSGNNSQKPEITRYNPRYQNMALNDLKTTDLYLPEYIHFYNSFPVRESDLWETSSYSELYGLNEIRHPGYKAYNNTAAQKISDKLNTQMHIEYSNGIFKNSSGIIPNLFITQKEVSHLITQFISLDLLATGFTSSEASALDVLVSYTIAQIHKISRDIKQAYHEIIRNNPNITKDNQKIRNDLLKRLINKYKIITTEVHAPQFFSEDEERTDDDSMMDMIYSNADDVDGDIEDD
ncbi:hypothetical protein NEAUS05_0299 [Nematocida ausubeli]|nr:hypothetical protein NEAUS07_0639 [Nematocida ausubeli]KAI5146963.1 hypothetical protein NEAUS05_0299 [Nematocida ausubeli]